MFLRRTPRRLLACVAAPLVVTMSTVTAAMISKEYKSGIVWPEPPLVTPASEAAPPSDAIVLFDGQDLSGWEGGENWEIKEGHAVAKNNGLRSKQAFGDCQLHVEFATPAQVEGKGQGRGNSGIYLMGRYEVQVLDSFENATYFDGQCGAIYKQQPPTVNASREPGQWQSYDIIFEAPRFDANGNLAKPAYVTVLHNGVVIHNHFELQGSTSYTDPPKYEPHTEKLPIDIQFHGNPVCFRNIWIRENIQPLVGKKPMLTDAPTSERVAEQTAPREVADQPGEDRSPWSNARDRGLFGRFNVLRRLLGR